jgi:hypothetical protein
VAVSSQDERRYWRITYLPSMNREGEVGWVYYGTEEELDAYLQEKHSCKCGSCQEEYEINKSWHDTAQACEYMVEEIKDEN